MSLSSDFTATSLTISDGDTFTTNGYNVDIGTGGITIAADGGGGGGALIATSGVGGSTTITNEGDWSNSGTFTDANNTSTVTFDGSGTSAISGNSTFYNLTCTTAGKQLTFTAGSNQTINGTLTLTGSVGNEILLRSSAASAYTLTFPNGTQTVSAVDVQYSNASGNDITANNSINSGNNDDGGASPHWVFGNVTRYWVGVADGEDWDDNQNWSSTSDGSGGADYPQAGDTAVFDGNDTSTITLDAAVTVGAITNAGGYTTTFDVAGYDVTVSGNFQWDGGTFDASTGTPTITVGGDWDSSSGTYTIGNSTIIMTGVSKTFRPGGSPRAYNLTIGDGVNPASVTTAGGNWSSIVSNNLVLADGGVSLTISGSFEYLTASSNLIMGTGSTLNINSERNLTRRINNSSSHISTGGSFGGAGTFQYHILAGTVANPAPVTARTYGVDVAISGVQNAVGALGGGASMDLGSKTLYLYDRNTNEDSYGILDNPSNIPVSAGALQVGDSVTYWRIGTLICRGATYTFTNVTVYSSNTAAPTIDCLTGGESSVWNVTGNVTIDDVRTYEGLITAGSSTWNVGGNWTKDANATFTAGTSTVNFDGTSQTINGSTTFYNLTKTVTSADTLSFASLSTQTISNQLTLTGASGQLLTLARSGGTGSDQWNINLQAGGLQTSSYLSVSNSNATGVELIAGATSTDGGNNNNWVFDGTTVTWTGTTDTDWDTASNWDLGIVPRSSDTVVITDQTNEPVLATDVTVTTLTINANSSLDLNGKNLSVSVVFTNNGTLRLEGGETVSSPTNATGSTVIYDGAGPSYTGLAAGDNYYHLEFNNSSSTWILDVALDVDGNLTITAGVLSTNNNNITVAGNWTNSVGTSGFTAGTGTVTLDGGNQSITGSTTFYNLTKSVTSAATLTFDNTATQTITNTLTLSGASGQLLSLRSDSSPNQWEIDPQGTRNVSYVDVRDSNNVNVTWISAANSVSSGNNTGWYFGALTRDIDNDGTNEEARDSDGNAANGYEVYFDPGGSVSSTAVLSTDGDRDNKIDHFIDTSGDSIPEKYWDPDDDILKDIALIDVNGDGTNDWVYDSDDNGTYDMAYDSVTTAFIDPFGIVFDSVTNNPIAGAVVTIYNASNNNPCVPDDGVAPAFPVTDECIAATDLNPVTTGTTGAYGFNAVGGSIGTYYIRVSATGYTYPSTRTSFPAGRIICPGDAACDNQSGSKGQTFVVGAVVITMDHPMDGMGSLIQLTKEANKKQASVGDIVTYTLSIENKTASAVTNVYIKDRIPPGFKYITDRAILDGQKMSNPEGQRPILFNIGTLSAGQTRIHKYQLVVGSGVTFGKYENSAWAMYADGTRISNVAKEEVMIIPDPLFDLGTVIGKVFWDINENRVQDGQEFIDSGNRPAAISNRITSTEAGIADVQIITEEGTIITTDRDGKYHLAGIAPGRHILRIDESTLPEGAYLTTDKAIIIDITPGILQKVNFGVNKKGLKTKLEAEVLEAEEISVEELKGKDVKDEDYTGLEVEEQEIEETEAAIQLEIAEVPEVSVEELEEKDIKEEGYTGVKIETEEIEEDGEVEEIKEQQKTVTSEEAEEKGPVHALIASAASIFSEFSEDVIFVGLADVKTGYTSVSGNIEPVEHDDKYTHGFWKEGRLAYYLKGKIKGKYLITSSFDTDREKKEIFRNLDPDKYYPVYGDASVVNYEATDTQGMLFLAVQWDKSKAMWGNYNTGITDTELAQFNRSLYGAKVHFETVSTTEAGKAETKLIFFQARAKQKAAHNEFLGTGGSLYYLKHRPITEGSEKVSLEVRDKNTDMVIATAEQTEGEDYEIDYSNARIMFYEPVTQMAESSTIISSALLDGNPLNVVVDYEYEVSGIYSKGSYGARVEQSLMPIISKFQISSSKFLKDIRIGGTYIKDEQDTGNYILSGVDTSLYLGEHTLITAEYAQSQAQGVEEFLSTDGGLTFTEVPTSGAAHGKAVSIKAQTRLFDKIGIMSYYKKIDRGFSESSTVSAQGKESAGGEITLDLSEKTHIKITHDMQKLLDEGNAVTASQVGASRTDTTTLQATRRMDKLKLTGEFRHIEVSGKKDEYISETNDSGSTVALRGDYDINSDLSVFLEEQVTLKQDYQTSAGVSAKVYKWLSLKVSETVGTEGNATLISARVKVDERTEFYNTYSISSSKIDGREQTIVSGGMTKITDNIELTTEAQSASSESEITRTNIFGLSGEINERWGLTCSYERGMVQSYDGDISKRSAGSIGVSYIERERIKASGKIELRIDEGEEKEWQYLSYNAVQWKVNSDTTLFGKINLSETINTTLNRTEAEYKEIVLGTAYRPVNFDRLNVIARYTYLEDETASGQTDMSDIQEQRAHVLAGEAVYDLTDRWQIVEKLAFKQSDERVTGFDFTKSQTVLWINRMNYNLYRDWQVGAEYRILWQKLARDMKEGALIEVSKYLGKNLQIGIGYNFTDFSDDLTYLDYTSQGPFIRFSMKITD